MQLSANLGLHPKTSMHCCSPLPLNAPTLYPSQYFTKRSNPYTWNLLSCSWCGRKKRRRHLKRVGSWLVAAHPNPDWWRSCPSSFYLFVVTAPLQGRLFSSEWQQHARFEAFLDTARQPKKFSYSHDLQLIASTSSVFSTASTQRA